MRTKVYSATESSHAYTEGGVGGSGRMDYRYYSMMETYTVRYHSTKTVETIVEVFEHRYLFEHCKKRYLSPECDVCMT